MPIPSDFVHALRDAANIVTLTGAGVSAESGVPTFRDVQEGLWARYDPAELATPEAYSRDPELVARWYDWRRTLCSKASPNPAHLALSWLERFSRDNGRRFNLVTQNVDRLHHAAGSTGVLELHGTLWIWRCLRCGEEREERVVPFTEYPPRCSCGGLRRPGVVWFGEALPEGILEAANQAASECDLFLSVGTSAVVYPAAGLAHSARRRGARIAEINAQPTPLSPLTHWSLQGRCGEILPELLHRALGYPAEQVSS
jgi:NAD-dependent deacetylase